MNNLTSVILAEAVLRQVGAKYGLTVTDLRVLGAVSLLSAAGGRPTYKAVATILNQEADSWVRRSARKLTAGGYISRETGHGRLPGAQLGLRIGPTGAALVGIIEREERAARLGVAGVEVGRWKRKYVRSGKYVGREAQIKAKRAAKESAKSEGQ